MSLHLLGLPVIWDGKMIIFFSIDNAAVAKIN